MMSYRFDVPVYHSIRSAEQQRIHRPDKLPGLPAGQKDVGGTDRVMLPSKATEPFAPCPCGTDVLFS